MSWMSAPEEVWEAGGLLPAPRSAGGGRAGDRPAVTKDPINWHRVVGGLGHQQLGKSATCARPIVATASITPHTYRRLRTICPCLAVFWKRKRCRNSPGVLSPEWEIMVTPQTITVGHRDEGKREGLKRSQADSLAAFPPQLGPPQARDSDRATILPCLEANSPKPGRRR